ncbi:MAG: DUF1178 family protein [Rhodobacteraceae bacterium]|nr:DUF1178 family protein [Paracoccaceae bacterium]
MIQYALKCAEGHSFDSWFQSADAYEKLSVAGHVSCAICGNAHVEKAIMAPRVTAARDTASEPVKPGALSQPANAAEQALAELRKKVEDNSDYVGMNFASEARAMHDGETPERLIHGEAKPEEAIKLIEEGIPVAPLPFMPNRKTN